MPVDGNIQDLTSYLARPVSIASGTITAGFVGNVLKSYYDGSTIPTAFPNFKNRVLGVFGFRATMVFTLQVSSTPFHQGLLALSYQYGAINSVGTTYERCTNSCTSTNLPHARLDLASETMVQLKVPYMGTTEYTTLENFVTTYHGLLGLNVVLPVPSVTGLSAPAYQIYLHLEDVELFGASPYSVTSVTLQSGQRLKGTSAEFEDETKPFSSATYAASRVVKWVSKGIPALSSIGGPTSWFLEKAAGAIRAFGFARPQITEPIMRMHRVDNINEHNVDNALPLSVLAPFSSNMLRAGPEFSGTDVDEMSMRYVLSQWSQLNRFVLDTTAAVNNLVYVTPISPCCFTYRHRTTTTLPYCNRPAPTVAPTGYNSFQPTTLMFFSQMFKLWRGSVKFRFTFAKTKMHGGRVMVSYTPSNASSTDNWLGVQNWNVIVPTMTSASPNPFGHSAIFNLRDGNVFEFEVPYISPRPYMTYGSYSGTLTMHVVDPLIAPPTVADSVGVLVEVCGGDDYELADPRSPIYPVHINDPPD